MKKNLSPAACQAISLSVLLMVCGVGIILTKAFVPSYIVPRITYARLIGLSMASLVLEHLIFRSGRPDFVETGLLAVVSFGVLTWATGLANVSDAGRVGIMGGIVYTVCLLVFTVMRAQLESSALKRKGAALVLAAALLILASQSLAGIPVLG